MEDDFKVEFRGDHIHVELTPDFTVEAERRDEFWNILRAACEKHGSSRVLVEGFVPRGQRKPAEVVDAGLKTAVIPHLWMAFHLEDFVPTEQSELYEVTAASQGVRVKFFSEHEAALKWLRINAPK